MMKLAKRILWVVSVVVIGALAVAGCRRKSAAEPSGVGERTGAAIDQAAEKTVDAAKATLSATKDAAGVAVEKTGEVMEKAGTAVEKTGTNMQK